MIPEKESAYKQTNGIIIENTAEEVNAICYYKK